MRTELNEMKIVDFDLYDVVHTKAGWNKFVEELFHHKLRLIPGKGNIVTPSPPRFLSPLPLRERVRERGIPVA